MIQLPLGTLCLVFSQQLSFLVASSEALFLFKWFGFCFKPSVIILLISYPYQGFDRRVLFKCLTVENCVFIHGEFFH